jgi:uncharacterized RDD family membrane protein YckC
MSYASWGKRVGGYLIDSLITSVPILIGYVILIATRDSSGSSSGAGFAIYGLLSLVSLGVLIYNRWIQGGKTGQTWGRKTMNIRLIGEATGQPIGALMAFVRDLAHIVDGLPCYIGWLFPLWDAKRQTLADKIMKTVVVEV